MSRRNGLDPSDNVLPNTLESGLRRRVCPSSCCPPKRRTEARSCSIGDERRYGELASGPRPIETVRLSPVTTEKSTNGRCGSETIVDDHTGIEATPRIEICESERTSGEKFPDRFTGYVVHVPSRELLTKYRDYVSTSQLDRYEACRSKRNGLQDECFLPVPRSVLELKRNELLSRDRSDTDRSRSCGHVNHTTVITSQGSSSVLGKDANELVDSICV